MLVLLVSGLYSPWCTAVLTRWLLAQVPAPPPALSPAAAAPPAVVLVGRGPVIAAATTARAAALVRQKPLASVYVSGDAFSTAAALQRMGVNPGRLAGDSCARTTWENAALTAPWLAQHHPTSPVLLITDSWQLAHASAAFARHGVAVTPIAVDPQLDARGRNQLALREILATLLYRLQGRMG